MPQAYINLVVEVGESPLILRDQLPIKRPGRSRGIDSVIFNVLTNLLATARTQGQKLPVICLDARRVRAALSMRVNKTDRDDARGFAELRPVEIHREFITAAARWMMAAKL